MMINFEALVLISIPILLLVIALKRKRGIPYLIFFTLFYIYLVFLLGAVIFPIPTGVLASRNDFNLDFFLSRINLNPFYFGPFATWETILIVAPPNILLTVPFGFGINFLKRVKGRDMLWLPLATGFGIELIQLIASLLVRYPYRVFDVTDLLLNAFGVLVGYGLFRLFAWIFRLALDSLNIQPKGILEYVYSTARPEGQ